MPYSPTSWVNSSSPDIDATNLNNIETGISKAPYGPDASPNQVAVWNGSAWVYQAIKNAQVDAAAAIAYSKLNLAGSIVNADIATGAALAYAKLNLAAAIKDSDIAAAQNLSKLSAVTGTPTGAKFLRDDGSWALPAGLATYRKTTAKIVNNTVSATDLFNGELSLAANDLGTNKKATIRARGDWKQNSGGTADLPRFQFQLGGTTILDTGATGGAYPNAATRYGWWIDIEIQASATNVQSVLVRGAIATGSPSGVGATLFTTGEGVYGGFVTSGSTAQTIAQMTGWNSGAKDDTASLTLVLNVINGSASASYETKLYDAFVEIV